MSPLERVRLLSNVLWLTSAVILICLGVLEAKKLPEDNSAPIISIICGFLIIFLYYLGIFTAQTDYCCCLSCGFIILVPTQMTAICLCFVNPFNAKIFALGVTHCMALLMKVIITLTTLKDPVWNSVVRSVIDSCYRPFGIFSEREDYNQL